MPNVNELHRLAWQRYEELELMVRDLRRPKGGREVLLRELRQLERELDIETIGEYNAPKSN